MKVTDETLRLFISDEKVIGVPQEEFITAAIESLTNFGVIAARQHQIPALCDQLRAAFVAAWMECQEDLESALITEWRSRYAADADVPITDLRDSDLLSSVMNAVIVGAENYLAPRLEAHVVPVIIQFVHGHRISALN